MVNDVQNLQFNMAYILTSSSNSGSKLLAWRLTIGRTLFKDPVPTHKTLSYSRHTPALHWCHYSTNAEPDDVMSFEEYRKLKKALKARSRVAGIPLAFIGMGVSSLINVQLNPRMFEMTTEEVQLILGLDPIVFAGLCGAASAIVGYMLGGTLFNATWRLFSRDKARRFDQKEQDFLKRLQKHRYSDVSKYEDDYYGEKVVTLSDYRQWVRQQQKRKRDMQKFEQTSSA